jgi:hypothetical protein
MHETAFSADRKSAPTKATTVFSAIIQVYEMIGRLGEGGESWLETRMRSLSTQY